MTCTPSSISSGQNSPIWPQWKPLTLETFFMHSRFSKSPPLSPISTSQVAIRDTWSPCFVLCVLGSSLKTFPALDNGLFFPQSWYTNRLCSWTTCHGGPLRLQGSTHSIHSDISNWPFFPTAQPQCMLVGPVGVLDSEIKSGVKSTPLWKLRTQCWGWLLPVF